jgi:hypothetical protein
MSNSEVEITGDLPKIIGNEENLYEGNLIYYFQVLFFKANNLYNPYHNFRHMAHVLWLCYKACQYYSQELAPRQMRTLLIAALFHDFDHTGRPIGETRIRMASTLRSPFRGSSISRL